MKELKRSLELLAPARDISVGREAILHGADAVYIGATSHGARSSAGNSIEDIKELVDFAHQFRARVYVTVNTIIYDNELQQVENLITNLYKIGVDALIVQDMAILDMKIPPIQLHASTQCDIVSVEKAKFLQEVGFSQLVLARELTLGEIKKICSEVKIPVECFIHGALCVSYSGRCHASAVCGGRSANRGECAQLCRLPYTLYDRNGKIIAKDKYLLSMHDFNVSHSLKELVDAGVSSFKIEGRLKDAKYVKNITSLYRKKLDEIIAAEPERYKRSSYGESIISFKPNASKSFNRGFTDFCLTNRKNRNLVSLLTPKSLGERVKINDLNNGDGISWIEHGKYVGARVNKITNGKLITTENVKIPKSSELRRTFDVKWEKIMSRDTAIRTIGVEMILNINSLELRDERGISTAVSFNIPQTVAKSEQNRRPQFEKLGNTIYRLKDFTDNVSKNVFIPNSILADLRRKGIEALNKAAKATYPFEYRVKENRQAIYPLKTIDYRGNVANFKAKNFYLRHGVEEIEPAIEVTHNNGIGKTVMTSRHCILRQLGMCLKHKPNNTFPPYTISNGKDKFEIQADCDRCEMRLIKIDQK